MSRYKVNSSRIAGHEFGDFVTADDLAGCNIEALVAGGHLKPSATPKTEKADNKETEAE